MTTFWTFLTYTFFLFDLSLATKSLVPRVLHGLHAHAARQTHSLARDLRVAFGGILAPRALAEQNVVYCKSAKQVPLSGGSLGNASASAPAPTGGGGASQSTTSTSAKAGPSSTAPSSSPWKLLNSYVCCTCAWPFDDKIIEICTARKLLLRWLGFFYRPRSNRRSLSLLTVIVWVLTSKL